MVTAVLVACGGDPAPPPVALSAEGQRGLELASAKGCAGCHRVDGKDAAGPTWKDLYNSEVTLTDGTTVTADDAYLVEAIKDPWAKKVKGYSTIMPRNSLKADEVAAIVTYIKELSPQTP